jgi:hypothetical protein
LVAASEWYEAPIYRDLGGMCDERGPDAWTMDLATSAA